MNAYGSPNDPPDRTWSMFVAGDFVGSGLDPDVVPLDHDLRGEVRSADVSIVNLESPLPGNGQSIAKSGPVLEASPSTPASLSDAGFDVATLANNHAMDYGVEGLEATTDACAAAGVETVGTGDDRQDAIEPLVAEVGGVRVAVFNVCEREFGVATATEPGTAWIGTPGLDERLREARAMCDVVVVVAHGGPEYAPLPSKIHRERLRGFAQRGADVVFSHHPHVPQGIERYRGTPIYYSLGNFRFEMGGRQLTDCGLGVELSFDGATLRDARVVPVATTDGVVHRLDDDRRDRLQSYVDTASAVVADDARFAAHWQEVADRLFQYRYTTWLRRGVGASASVLFDDPWAAFSAERRWDPEERREDLLVLFNLLRNGSHRDVLETALGVRTGVVDDRRTDEVRATTRALFEGCWEDPPYDEPTGPERALTALRDRLVPSSTND